MDELTHKIQMGTLQLDAHAHKLQLQTAQRCLKSVLNEVFVPVPPPSELTETFPSEMFATPLNERVATLHNEVFHTPPPSSAASSADKKGKRSTPTP
jgi:hypothetical protein